MSAPVWLVDTSPNKAVRAHRYPEGALASTCGHAVRIRGRAHRAATADDQVCRLCVARAAGRVAVVAR